MEQKTLSIKMQKQRKLFVMLPLLVLPFITFMFWSLGGGKMETADAQTVEEKGFNSILPNPKADEGYLDKMNYYDRASRDSAKLEELIKKDPNYAGTVSKAPEKRLQQDTLLQRVKSSSDKLSTGTYRNANEEKVYKKLAALQNAIDRPATKTKQIRNPKEHTASGTNAVDNPEMERLEAMMQSMNQPAEQDPELKQLNGMLENILDIQHPERMQEKIRKASEEHRGQVFSVSAKESENNVSTLQDKEVDTIAFHMEAAHNGFYSLEDNTDTAIAQNAIPAVIHESQTLVNGATVKLRLTSDVYINGLLIPKDNFLFGTASLKGERLSVSINSLRYNNSLFPVDLSVYDMDGLEGIYIPGAISRDVAKASADRSVQSMGVMTMSDSWEAQAAGAGIEASKSLFSKKVKLVKVTVKAGYQVLLKDSKQKQKESIN